MVWQLIKAFLMERGYWSDDDQWRDDEIWQDADLWNDIPKDED